jgi:parallel beta-helix repeat protein
VTAPACTYAETVTIRRPLTLRGYGSVIDGGGVRTIWVAVRSSDVTLEGFTMRNAAPGIAQSGSIDVDGVDRFTARDLSLSGGSAADIRIWNGSGHTVADSDIAAGRQEGIVLWQVVDTAISGNRIHGNNTAGYDPGLEAGGLKAGGARNLLLSGNEVDSNAGPGLWCDGMCVNTTITGNSIHDNTNEGILFEISSGAAITGNRVWNNGWGFTDWGWGGGIVVSSSSGAQVANNVVAWNADGIVVLSQDRSDAPLVTGNYVHDNTIILAPRSGDTSDQIALGWLQDWAGNLFDPASNNRGAGNAYWIGSPEPEWARFGWNGPIDTLATFNATPGEAGGRYLTDAEKNSVLSAAGIAPTLVAGSEPGPSRIAAALGGGLAAVAAAAFAVVVLRSRRARPGSPAG